MENRVGLHNKIITTLIFVILFFGISIIFTINTIFSKKYKDEAIQKSVSFAQHLTVTEMNYITERDALTLKKLIDIEKNMNSETIGYIFITDPRNNVLAHTFKGDFPAELKAANSNTTGKIYNMKTIDMEEGLFYDIAVNVFEKGSIIGIIRIGLKDRGIQGSINKILGVLLIIMFLNLIPSFIIGFWLSGCIVEPVKKLQHVTEEMAKVNLEVRVDIQTKDELGQLGEAFNKMVNNLQNTTVSRDALVKEVEERKKIEDKLIEYTKKIEDINKELDDFTYIVSHDLKEPLRSINAFAKFVTADYKDKLDEEGRNYLERIQANAVIMQKLIEDLLEISRLERRKNPFEDANTGNMLNEIKIRMEHTLTEKKVEMVISEKMPVVFCDRVRVTEVFANLISNAVKYSDKTHPRVEVGYKDTVAFYEFYVKDNGPGIPEEYHEKIFKIFQRLGKKEEHEGTGVGLTIAKKIVEMHKGRIWVESKVGEGTTFYFSIPKSRDYILGKKKIGEILVEKKIVDENTIKKILEEQKKKEA
ncbi:MAG: ATP-binding protein [bacterium]